MSFFYLILFIYCKWKGVANKNYYNFESRVAVAGYKILGDPEPEAVRPTSELETALLPWLVAEDPRPSCYSSQGDRNVLNVRHLGESHLSLFGQADPRLKECKTASVFTDRQEEDCDTDRIVY